MTFKVPDYDGVSGENVSVGFTTNIHNHRIEVENYQTENYNTNATWI